MQLNLVETFDIPELPTLARSQLIRLAPRELHTSRCEALISYITRLAGAHVVRPNVLVKEVILPLTSIQIKTATRNFYEDYSRTINSYTKYARTVSAVLEQLTLQNDLWLLTFLPWGSLLDPKGSRLLRDHVAICQECLEEQRNGGRDIYYPLLWYLRDARICSKHDRWLTEVCQDCGCSQNFVSYHAMLGYCSHCGGWLGIKKRPETSLPPDHIISDRDRFMTAALEQMIAQNGKVKDIATHEQFVDRLEGYSQALTGGNMKAFEIRLGFHKNMIVNWKNKSCRPRIDVFLELCFRLRVLPMEFMKSPISSEIDELIGQYVKNPPTNRERLSKEKLDLMRKKLIDFIDGPEVLTQLAVAEALGCPRRFLNHHFPELARAISEKHKRVTASRTEVKRQVKLSKTKEITQEMFDQRQPISKRKVDKALQSVGLTMADGEVRRTVKRVIQENLERSSATLHLDCEK